MSMTRDEFPADIFAAAEAVVNRGYNVGLIDAVAEALLSERRQCADIAYNAALYSGCPADFIAEEIAETVRNGRRP